MSGKVIGFPHSPGLGGPGSFQSRFEDSIRKLGWSVTYAGENVLPDVVLVVGGTKKLRWLFQMKRSGIPIIYRLDGINWLHRKQNWGLRHLLEGEYRNLNNKLIHAFFADYIVYQSVFVKDWWERVGFLKRKKYSIIYNGVDLALFNPNLARRSFEKIVLIEGTIDYSPYAVRLINELRNLLPENVPFELYGEFIDEKSQKQLDSRINYLGGIPRSQVPEVLQNSIYISLDINPACPNTVIEALACGVPVVAFDTGSLNEIVNSKAGEVVPYGANPWNIDYPDALSLKLGLDKVIEGWSDYSSAARDLAVEKFDIDDMVNSYLKILESI